MLLWLTGVLTAEEVKLFRHFAANSMFKGGALTAPGLAATGVKRNEQLATDSDDYQRFARIFDAALNRNETFRTAAVPKRLYPPILSRYRPGMVYGTHIDNPIRQKPVPMRLDLSITVFLNSPETYEGGELVLETPYGEKQVKLPAGDGILYPTTMLHRVAEIKSGERLAAVTWIQSMVQDQFKRSILYDLALLTQWAMTKAPESPEYHKLNATRANLVRMWATD